jgi:hypothetical protein
VKIRIGDEIFLLRFLLYMSSLCAMENEAYELETLAMELDAIESLMKTGGVTKPIPKPAVFQLRSIDQFQRDELTIKKEPSRPSPRRPSIPTRRPSAQSRPSIQPPVLSQPPRVSRIQKFVRVESIFRGDLVGYFQIDPSSVQYEPRLRRNT